MWPQTYALTLLFFLIATGVGLFILLPVSRKLFRSDILTRAQFLALGFILGAPASATFLQLLSLFTTNLQIDLALMLVGASLGWLLSAKLWRPRSADLAEIIIWTGLSIPLALVTWWWTFGVISEFPFADIGADVHWMKSAQEFADSGVLNPYASQTYTDIRAALAGLLAGSLGLDLLQFNWAYRFFSILYLLILFYAFADSIFLDRRRKWLAFFFAGATNTLGLLTNGSLALAGSALFLAVLIRMTAKQPSPAKVLSRSALWPATGAALVILLAYGLNNNTLSLAMAVATPVAFSILYRSERLANPTAARILVTVLWSAALILVHRGSYLFIPAAIAGWLFYLLVSKTLSEGASRFSTGAWIAALVMPATGVVALGCIAAARFGYLPRLDFNAVFSFVTLIFFGTRIWPEDEISLGAGPEIAAIEIGRALGPLFIVYIGLMFTHWWIVSPPSKLGKLEENREQRDNVTRLLWSWIAGCGLSLIVLSGFPFLYRLIFVISCYFTIATTELLAQLLIDPVSSLEKKRRTVAVATVAIALLAAATHWIDWSNHPHGGYQAMLRPALVAGAVFVLACCALGFSRSRLVATAGLVAAIGLTVTIDRAGIATMFRIYSYGRLPDDATIVSHYDADDLETNRWLRKNMPRAIVVSDPYTLGLAKAITGAPGLYLFSNLDTVNAVVASNVKTILSGVVATFPDDSNRVLKTCVSILPYLQSLNQEASVQMGKVASTGGIFKPVRLKKQEPDATRPKLADVNDAGTVTTERSIADALEVLKTPKGKWSIVAVINPRTMQWLRLQGGQRLSYFPVREWLDGESLSRLKLNEGPFPVLFSAGQSYVVSIGCDATSKQ